MATKALSDHTTEELKDQALEDLRTCVSNLLRATLCIHQSASCCSSEPNTAPLSVKLSTKLGPFSVRRGRG